MSLFQTYLENQRPIPTKLSQKILKFFQMFHEITPDGYVSQSSRLADFIFNEENLGKMIYYILDKNSKFNKDAQTRIITQEQFKELSQAIAKEVIKWVI